MAEEDEKYWATIAILHGIAYEMFHNKKGKSVLNILQEENISDEQIHAIQAHGYGSFTNTKPNCYMEYIFCAVDQLSSFVVSCAIHCNDDIKKVNAKMVKALFKNQDYSVGTKRIKANIDKAGKSLDWFIENILIAMQKN